MIKNGRPPLHAAIESGQDEIAETLLESKPNLAAQDSEGYTPLHIAAKNGNVTIGKLLIKAGADPALPDNRQQTALHLAVLHNSFDFLAFLFKSLARDFISPVDERGNTPLHYAAANKDTRMIMLWSSMRREDFMKFCRKPNTSGKLPIHIALEENDFEKVKLLFSVDENFDSQVFKLALRSCDPKIISYVLGSGGLFWIIGVPFIGIPFGIYYTAAVIKGNCCKKVREKQD